MNTNKAGRPKRHKWVYLSVDAVRKTGQPIKANPAAAIDARRRNLVKSIVATLNRGHDRKVRVTFSADETEAVFTFKN